MKVIIKGKGEITLNKSDFAASGGEGDIYKKGSQVFKIYHDPKNVIQSGKLKELQEIKSDKVIKPNFFILDSRGNHIGFTMNLVNGIPLCQLFTTPFRQRENIDNNTIIELVEDIKLTTNVIHKAHCLVVDGNENNYLTDSKTFKTAYFIDVACYKTPTFPPTALMPSVKDWHTKGFTELSDWFAFAIISCQLFIGLHPFKGTHPNYKKGDFESRMKNNISIFNPKVSVPAPTRDFGLIPSKYMDWYIKLFEKGQRLLPPDLPGQIVVNEVKVKLIQSTNSFVIELIKEFPEDILFCNTINGEIVVKTKSKTFIGKKEFQTNHKDEIIFTNKFIVPIKVNNDNGKLNLTLLQNNVMNNLSCPDLDCDEFMILDNTLYVRDKDKVFELEFIEMNNRIVTVIKTSFDIMLNSSKVFRGVIYQDVFRKSYLVIPIPKVGSNSLCIIKEIPELESYKIIDGKYLNKVCCLALSKNGKYYLMILNFDDQFSNYSVRLIEDINIPLINITVLDNGIVIMFNDEKLEIFSNNINNQNIKSFDDSQIDSSMKLCNDGSKTMFYKGKKLYSIKVKK